MPVITRDAARDFLDSLALPPALSAPHEKWLVDLTAAQRKQLAAGTIDGPSAVANGSPADKKAADFVDPGKEFENLLRWTALSASDTQLNGPARLRRFNDLPVAAAIVLVMVPMTAALPGDTVWSDPFFVVLGAPTTGTLPSPTTDPDTTAATPAPAATDPQLDPNRLFAGFTWAKSRSEETLEDFFTAWTAQQASSMIILDSTSAFTPCLALTTDMPPPSGSKLEGMWLPFQEHQPFPLASGEQTALIDGRINRKEEATGAWMTQPVLPLPGNHVLPIGAVFPAADCESLEAFVDSVRELTGLPPSAYRWLDQPPVDAWFRAFSFGAKRLARKCQYFGQVQAHLTQQSQLLARSTNYVMLQGVVKYLWDYLMVSHRETRTKAKWSKFRDAANSAFLFLSTHGLPTKTEEQITHQPFLLLACTSSKSAEWRKILELLQALPFAAALTRNLSLDTSPFDLSTGSPAIQPSPLPDDGSVGMGGASTLAGASVASGNAGSHARGTTPAPRGRDVNSYLQGFGLPPRSLSPTADSFVSAASKHPPIFDLTQASLRRPDKRYKPAPQLAAPAETDETWFLPGHQHYADELGTVMRFAIATDPLSFLPEPTASTQGCFIRDDFIQHRVTREARGWQLFGTYAMPQECLLHLPPDQPGDAAVGAPLEPSELATPGLVGPEWATLFAQTKPEGKTTKAQTLLMQSYTEAVSDPSAYRPFQPAWHKDFPHDPIVLEALATGVLTHGKHISRQQDLRVAFTLYHMLASVTPTAGIYLPRNGLSATQMCNLIQNFLFIANSIWLSPAHFPNLPGSRSPAMMRGIFVAPFIEVWAKLRDETMRAKWDALSNQARHSYTKCLLAMLTHLIWWCDKWYNHKKPAEFCFQAVPLRDPSRPPVLALSPYVTQANDKPIYEFISEWRRPMSLLLDPQAVGTAAIPLLDFWAVQVQPCLVDPTPQVPHAQPQLQRPRPLPQLAQQPPQQLPQQPPPPPPRPAGIPAPPNDGTGRSRFAHPGVAAPTPLFLWQPNVQQRRQKLLLDIMSYHQIRAPKFQINGAFLDLCFAYCLENGQCRQPQCRRLHLNVSYPHPTNELDQLHAFVTNEHIASVIRPSAALQAFLQRRTS